MFCYFNVVWKILYLNKVVNTIHIYYTSYWVSANNDDSTQLRKRPYCVLWMIFHVLQIWWILCMNTINNKIDMCFLIIYLKDNLIFLRLCDLIGNKVFSKLIMTARINRYLKVYNVQKFQKNTKLVDWLIINYQFIN